VITLQHNNPALPPAVEDLLQHALDPTFDAELVIVKGKHYYGIALVIDGWYEVRRDDEFGCGAENVLPIWRELLDEAIAEVNGNGSR
jgi:hypothetical protein